MALVLVLVADGSAGRGGQGGMQAAAGIDLRLGVKGQDPVTGSERLALVKPLVQVNDDLRLGLEVRVAGAMTSPGLCRVNREDLVALSDAGERNCA